MSRGSFVNDLLCAQLHPPGSCRMVMVVHVVNASKHERAAYRAMIVHVNETLKPGSIPLLAGDQARRALPIEFD